MRKHNVHRARQSAATMPAGSLSLRFFILTVICASILAAGFFFAARQHFTSMDFGIKNSRLRKQLDDLEAEHRRLVLAKEISLSPLEVKKTARYLGFRENQQLPVASPVMAKQTEQTDQIVQSEPAAKPTLASVRETVKPKESKSTTTTEKKLVKPIVKQTIAQADAPTERPRRVAETDKRVTPTALTSFSKFE